ncbi:MAG: F-box protein [Proteobacteria bacterium]|nr:F-box protein [Pseudomonadota bacterium]
MFKKISLKYLAFMVGSFLASMCAQASLSEDLADREAEQISPIGTLPPEVTQHILSFLDAPGAARVRGVSSLWQGILSNQHGKAFTHSNGLFGCAYPEVLASIPNNEMAKTLAFHIIQSGFAPLEHVLISPDLYPQGARVLQASDLQAHPDIISGWYTALFGHAPQDAHGLALVMAVLPQMLVREHISAQSLGRMTAYVEKIAKSTHFVHFTGDESQEDVAALKEAPCTLVVRAQDLQACNDALAALLEARQDHRVVLCLDSEDFIQGGALKMSKDDIPGNLRHLTLSDPFGKVTSVKSRFLNGSTGLISFETRGFTRLMSIGNGFLGRCLGLTFFNPGGLGNASIIKDFFLAGCTGLTSFDGRDFTRLTCVGNYFLWGGTGLVSFQSRGLTSLISIGHSFLAGCTSLRFFDAQGMGKVRSIGGNFLLVCADLTTFDPTPLTSLAHVGQHFLPNANLSLEDQAKVDALLARVAG